MNQYNNELYHFGVKGMKWGVRKYADKNGKLNAAGRKKYGVKSVDEWKDRKKEMRSRKGSLETKANKKYKLDEYQKYANQESSSNSQHKKMYEEVFGKESASTYKGSTYHKDNYNKQAEKARNYVDKHMKEEFGQSYTTWENNKATAQLVAMGTTFLVGTGIMIAEYARK